MFFVLMRHCSEGHEYCLLLMDSGGEMRNGFLKFELGMKSENWHDVAFLEFCANSFHLIF